MTSMVPLIHRGRCDACRGARADPNLDWINVCLLRWIVEVATVTRPLQMSQSAETVVAPMRVVLLG